MRYFKALRNILILLFVFTLISFSLPGGTNSYAASMETRLIDKQGCTYWITKSSHKRHNSKCRWYKKSKGYCTDDPDEGIACKICGG